jgi:hypothetical protein
MGFGGARLPSGQMALAKSCAFGETTTTEPLRVPSRSRRLPIPRFSPAMQCSVTTASTLGCHTLGRGSADVLA